MSKLIELTDENFEQEVLKSEEPILVDFHAEHRCPPCQAMKPILEEVAEESEKVRVGKMDVDAVEASHQFDIMGVPTFILFKNGEAIEQTSGMQAKESLLELMKKAQ